MDEKEDIHLLTEDSSVDDVSIRDTNFDWMLGVRNVIDGKGNLLIDENDVTI